MPFFLKDISQLITSGNSFSGTIKLLFLKCQDSIQSGLSAYMLPSLDTTQIHTRAICVIYIA